MQSSALRRCIQYHLSLDVNSSRTFKLHKDWRKNMKHTLHHSTTSGDYLIQSSAILCGHHFCQLFSCGHDPDCLICANIGIQFKPFSFSVGVIKKGAPEGGGYAGATVNRQWGSGRWGIRKGNSSQPLGFRWRAAPWGIPESRQTRVPKAVDLAHWYFSCPLYRYPELVTFKRIPMTTCTSKYLPPTPINQNSLTKLICKLNQEIQLCQNIASGLTLWLGFDLTQLQINILNRFWNQNMSQYIQRESTPNHEDSVFCCSWSCTFLLYCREPE